MARLRWFLLLALLLTIWFVSRAGSERLPPAPRPTPIAEPVLPEPDRPAPKREPAEAPAAEPAQIVDDGVSDLLAHEPIAIGEPPDSDRPTAVLVVDGRGRPVVGAEVESMWGSGVTNARGLAWLPRILGDPSMPANDRTARTVTVRAAGFVKTEILAGHSASMEVVRLADRGEVLAGTCVDTDGRPLAGVTLTSDDWNTPGVTVTTDEAGRFETDRAPRRRLWLRVFDRRYRSEPVEVVPPERDVVLTAVPGNGRPGPAGPTPLRSPIVSRSSRGAEIVVTARGGDRYEPLYGGFANGEVLLIRRRWSTSGPSARVRLPRDDLRWLGIGRFPTVVQEDVPVGAREVRLSLGKSATVTARLVDRRGRPLEVGRLILRWPGSRESARWANPSRRGRIDGVGPGRCDLAWSSEILREDIVLRRDVRMPDPPEDRDLGVLAVRPAEMILRVLVTDGEGRPIEGAIVDADLAYPPAAGRTDSSGLFEYPLFDLTGFAFEVSAEGFEPKRLRTPTDDVPSLIEVRLSR